MRKRREHKVGDMVARYIDGVKYTVGWITHISEQQYYTKELDIGDIVLCIEKYADKPYKVFGWITDKYVDDRDTISSFCCLPGISLEAAHWHIEQ